MMGRVLASAALVLALAACGEEEVSEADPGDERIASGEVLEGTISDDMIPLDQLRSQAPPLRIAPEGNGDAPVEGGEAAETSGEETAPAEEAEPAEAAPPAPAQ